MDPTEVQSIDQGVFAFPKPTFRHGMGYFFSIVGMFIAFGLYSSSLIIPDVPRVDEADVLPYLHDDMAAYEYGPLQDGYDVDEYEPAAFVVVPLELVEGTVAYENASGWKTTKVEGVGIIASRWRALNPHHGRRRGHGDSSGVFLGRLTLSGR